MLLSWMDFEEIGEGEPGGGVAVDDAPPADDEPLDEAPPADDAPVDDAPPADVEPAEYVPNHKFKVLDKELEFPEWAKAAVDSPEREAEIREAMEKVHGFDHIKNSRNTLAQQLTTVQGEHTRTKQSIQALAGYLQKGDLPGFFAELKIPDEAVIAYAQQVANMTPEQKVAMQKQRDIEARLANYESELGQHRQTARAATDKARSDEVDIYLAQPDVSKVAQAFDARAGKPGAFKEEVYNRGRLYWHTHQKDIPADQAVRETLQLFGGAASPVALIAPGTTASQPGVAKPSAPVRKPVIPNFTGSGVSPTKVVPKSIKQLRELGAKAAEANR